MKIALVENLSSDFISARLRFAIFLMNKGFKVTAIIPKDSHNKIIRNYGINVVEVSSNIRGKGVFNKIKYLVHLKSIFSKESFDTIHFYRLQPNIIGTIVAGLFTKSKIVNHVTGLGYVFTNNSIKNQILQFITRFLYKMNIILFNPYFIFQNESDKYDLNILNNQKYIPGSAVNEDIFNPSNFNPKNKTIIELHKELKLNNNKTFLFVSRLIKEKGILLLIEAFNKINSKKNIANLLIVGGVDDQNPSSLKVSDICKLIIKKNQIKFLGKRNDINNLIAFSDVSILPTYYREGTPRFLLESMAMSKPIITTDMPGCNHLIKNNSNGIVIKPNSVEEIECAVKKILTFDLEKLGSKSLSFYNEKFSENIVYNSIYDVYNLIKK